MIKLNEIFLFEDFDEMNVRQMGWSFDENTWWQENRLFFHGTHVANLDAIASEGLKAGPGSKGVGVYLALDPFTARGYASMAAAGGEKQFKKQARPKSTPMNERAVLVVMLSSTEIKKLKISEKDSRILDKPTWEKEGKGNPRYWELAEVVYPIDLPANYIKGYMIKG